MTTSEPRASLVRRIHDSHYSAVVAMTGGGSLAISDLLTVPGASQTVLEAIVPYSASSLIEFLHCRPEQFCSPHTARQMAMAAFRRAESLHRSQVPTPTAPLLGIGCTAGLRSDRPKSGSHRIHLAAQSACTTWSRSLELTKGSRSREEEERIAADLLLDLLAVACKVHESPLTTLLPDEQLVRRRTDAPPAWCELLSGRSSRTDERPGFQSSSAMPRAVFPGSFHPLHDGHRRMAAVAARKLNTTVDYEISIENVEKPPLDFEEMNDRATQFASDARVWLTRAPRMKQKAALFPGATIVIGVDTLLRVADPKFAGGSDAERDRDLAEIASRGGRFLVFGRSTTEGFQTLDDVKLPDSLRALCIGVSETEFREDVSSTDLRKQGSTTEAQSHRDGE